MNLSTQNYKGTRDIYPEDMRLRNYIFATWKEVVESFGYEEYDAPILEPLEIYAAKSGQEIVNEQTYTFVDRGDRTVAIRPEMTPSISRMVAARRQEMPMPARLYSISNFMRYERPQKGREREFWQLNLDLFGVENIDADAEIITISDKILRKFGADESMFTININDRRLTDYIMREYLELDQDQAQKMIKLFDRRDKIGEFYFPYFVNDVILGGTGGASLAPSSLEQEKRLGEFMAKINKVMEVDEFSDLPNEILRNAPIGDLKNLLQKLQSSGINSAKFDPTLMRGFDYYTGIVFEVFDESPENNRSMFGGGRYDGLISLFGVETLPVVGAAPGETTTIEFLRAHNLIPKLKPSTQVVLIPVGEVNTEEIAEELRTRKINVSTDFTNRKMDKKIKAATKAQIPFVLFVGENETMEQKFPLKNLETGEQEVMNIDQIASSILNQ